MRGEVAPETLGAVSSEARPPTSMADCPKRKKYDYSNKNDYNNKNDYKKKNHFRDKKKKSIKKIMFQVCAALSDFDFSSEDSSNSEEDEKVNHKKMPHEQGRIFIEQLRF
jgi:hypothetical protein